MGEASWFGAALAALWTQSRSLHGGVRVISVDYREGPEFKFPAACVDVAAVYRGLLKKYPAKNIGIYGCSSGGMITAESVAWFSRSQLPRRGAIGIFGSGAFALMRGDSGYTGALLFGTPPWSEDLKSVPYFDVPGLERNDPLASPCASSAELRRFPPTLLISGTRDPGLSAAAYTNSQLVKLGVQSELHVWEGAAHCSFALPLADPKVPETREAWNVIVKFFDRILGYELD